MKTTRVLLKALLFIVGIMIISSMKAQNPQKRATVEVLYGYLKIFPNELGAFSSEPTTVINQINAQCQYGYNNWRIPTDEELSLMRANNYIGSAEYMTKEHKQGIVLLVTDGKDYEALLKEQQEEARKRDIAEQQRRINLKAQGYVDLGLPSGTLWKNKNEEGLRNYDNAVRLFGGKLPTIEQFAELSNSCQWIWTGQGYKVIGPSGESIYMFAGGYRAWNRSFHDYGVKGFYWSSTVSGSYVRVLYFDNTQHSTNSVSEIHEYCESLVHLVQ